LECPLTPLDFVHKSKDTAEVFPDDFGNDLICYKSFPINFSGPD